MNKGVIKACLSTGVMLWLVMLIGLWPMAQFLPPPSPQLNSAYWTAYYSENTLGIRLAALTFMICGSLYVPFFGALAYETWRIERGLPFWTLLLILSTAMAGTLFFLSGLGFGLASFRPDRPVEITGALNDLAWFLFVIPAFPGALQAAALGGAILRDDRPKPLMPRWTGFANLWIAFLFCPGCAIMIFKSGPFAWNGIFAFWIPGIFFATWLTLMTCIAWKSVDVPD